MKWCFIILLLVNVTYLGWEIDRSAKQHRANRQTGITIPAGNKRLELVSELKTPPVKKQAITSKKQGYKGLSAHTVPLVKMNPNAKRMIQTLLNGSDVIRQNNGTISEKVNAADIRSYNNKKTVCYTYGPIPDEQDSRIMSQWLRDRNIEYEQRQTAEGGRQKFWVYLAPQESTKVAEATAMVLRKKGISDLQLIRSGDLFNAISLGLFSTQANVNKRLREIKKHLHAIKTIGYHPVPVVVPYVSDKQLYWFDVKIVPGSSYVNDLFTDFPARFNALPVSCNETAMQ